MSLRSERLPIRQIIRSYVLVCQRAILLFCFWKTENLSKNTCVNAPAAIAACLLWKSYGEIAYRDKANAIIDWVKSVLSDGHGWIYDSIRTNGPWWYRRK